MLNRDAIAQRIPHQGRMCLLDSVLDWNQNSICCQSLSHLAPDHPLRANGGLGAACGVEYAAQAMAVHGALVAQESAGDGASGARPRAGYLASMRSVVLHVERLDTADAPLLVKAERISGDENTVLYSFTIHANGQILLSGRAAVVLNAPPISLDSQRENS
jgi:predicted hotdog family 3-hydroxylacyl-ACP dehydratase